MSDRGEDYADMLFYGDINMVGLEEQRAPRDIPVPRNGENVSDSYRLSRSLIGLHGLRQERLSRLASPVFSRDVYEEFDADRTPCFRSG